MSDSLYSRLRELAGSDLYGFHMPGHKRQISDGMLMDWYSMDISEISGFDNLHFSEDILLHAQKKAAMLYQADETFYLINGSTAGILSAISAVNDCKKLLISRDSHFSVYHAAYINDIRLVYVYPQYDESTGLARGITAGEVAEKLKDDPDIGAVLITSPTYEGIASDVAGIAKAAHKQNACLIVDQAHGAHFGFHPAFPENAVRQDADLVIHSLHKTLPALTQTALLHVNGKRINRRKLQRFLRIYQSSSPSYPLMAGIEYCLELVKKEGAFLLGKMVEMRNELIDRISQLSHFRIHPDIDDPCKIIILTKGITGKQLYEILHERYLLEMEMAADNYVIAIITMMDKAAGLTRLAQALTEIDGELPAAKAEKKSGHFNKAYEPEIITTIKKAYDAEAIEIPLKAANGYISAEFIALYPPGRPLLVPGEKVDHDIIEMIVRHQKNGHKITGLTPSNQIIVNKEPSFGY
jgi:arginine/lysine/ornithine decarboxylase